MTTNATRLRILILHKMGKPSTVAAECSIPAYCIKTLGSRHILIGGGGGGARTGVLNQLQLFLLTYGTQFTQKTGAFTPASQLIAQLNCTVDTAQFANMNMDSIGLDCEPEKGRYLVAVGQDQFCTLYETTGFCINQEMASNGLALEFRSVVRIETDKKTGDDSYQKCVRLFRTQNQSIKMLTAGTDGYVRLWSIAELLNRQRRSNRQERTVEIPELEEAEPELEIHTGSSAIEEIDVSMCGQIVATVLPQSTLLWDLNDRGSKLTELPKEDGRVAIISKKFKVRTLRFTGLDRSGKSAVFVTAHNQQIRSAKEVSYLGLWSFTKTRECRLIQSRIACKETISCLELSECGRFTAVGTMGGSVAIFDTQSLESLLLLHETHSLFVTGLTFLPQKTYDIKDLGRIGDKANPATNVPPGRCFLPSICANSRATLVSISGADKRILIHQLPFPAPSTASGFLLQISLFAAFLYTLFWAVFIYHY